MTSFSSTPQNIHQILHPEDLLRSVRVADTMTPSVWQATPDTSMLAIAQHLAEHQVSCVVIAQNQSAQTTSPNPCIGQGVVPVGILTERDVSQLQASQANLAETQAQAVMSTPVLAVQPHESLWDAHLIMQQHPCQYLAVTEASGALVGVVTQTMISQVLNPVETYRAVLALQHTIENQAKQLREAQLQQQELHQALSQSEDRLSNVLKNAAVFIRSLRAYGDRTLVSDYRSPGCEHITGYTVEEFNANPDLWFSRLFDDDRPTITHQLFEAIAASATTTLEYRFWHKDGSLRWISDVLTSEWDEQSQCWHVTVVGTDASQRKFEEEQRRQTTLQLRESEARFRAMFEQAAVGMNRADLSGRFIQVNQRFCDLLGYSDAELLQLTYLDITHPDDLGRENLDQLYSDAMRSYSLEKRYLRKDGSILWAYVTLSIVRDDNGQPISDLAIIEDISERKQAEEQLRQSQATNTALRNAIPDLLLLMRRDGTYLEASVPSGFPMLKPNIDVKGKNIREILPSRIADERLSLIERALNTQHIQVQDYSLWADQGVRWEECRIVPVNQDEVLVVVRDMTERKQLELALNESQARLARIMDSAIASICSYRLFDHRANSGNEFPDSREPDTWNYEYYSAGCEAIFGFTADEFLTNKALWRSRICPSDWKTVILPRYEKIYAGRTSQVEYRFYRKDGSICWVSETAASHWDLDQQCWIVTTVSTDISDRKAIEAQLQHRIGLEQLVTTLSTQFINLRSDELASHIDWALQLVGEFVNTDRSYLLLLNETGICVVNTHEWRAPDVETQCISYQNRSIADQTWSLDQLKTVGLLQVANVDDLPPEAAAERRDWQRQSIQSLLEVPITSRGEMRGIVGFDAVRAARNWTNSEISLLRLVGEIFVSALERHWAEEALHKSEERWQLAIQGNNDGIWDLNLATGKVFRSPRWAEIMGYAPEEISNDNHEWSDRIHPDDLNRVQTTEQLYLSRQTPTYTVEYRLRCKDGTYKWILSRAQALWDEDNTPLRMVGTIRDISDIKQTELEIHQAKEAAEAASHAKSTFLANMSHELRTPLNAILGFSQLLEYSVNLDAEEREQLDIINRSGEHLLHLINDILEISRIEAGRTTANITTFDLFDCLRTLMVMFELKARGKGIDLWLEKDEDIGRVIQTDEQKLRQILINLLSNGIKFTTKGYVKLKVAIAPDALTPLTPNSVTLQFDVVDTGCGIAPDDIPNLFEPFVQAQKNTMHQEGTGLGLPISQNFVRLLGGELTVASCLNEGSVFRFTLPVILVESDEASVELTSRYPAIPESSLQPTDRDESSRTAFFESADRGQSSASSHPLQVSDLSMMSTAWLEAMYQMGIRLDSNQVIQLIDEIPPEQKDVAQSLLKKVDSFDFESILNLIQATLETR